MSSKTRAAQIKVAVLDALQAADELGGPDFPDYVRLMEELQNECEGRAAMAREVFEQDEAARKAAEVLAYFREHVNANASVWQTGGGCTAIGIPLDDCHTEGHWLVTDDASAPETLQSGCAVGLYRGESWVCFNVADCAAAAALINAYVSDSLS